MFGLGGLRTFEKTKQVAREKKMIWGGDHDNDRNDEHLIETNLSCRVAYHPADTYVCHDRHDIPDG